MTAQKPNLVIVKRKSKKVKLVPWDTTANLTVVRFPDPLLEVSWDPNANLTADWEVQYAGQPSQSGQSGNQTMANPTAGKSFSCHNIPLKSVTGEVVNNRNRAAITQLCLGIKGEQGQQCQQERPASSWESLASKGVMAAS